MNNDTMKKIFLFILALCLVIFSIILIFLVYIRLSSMTKDESPLSLPTPVLVNPKGGASIPFASPTPTQTTVDFKVDYSHINQVAPGKNTINDVKKTQGNPISSSVSGDKIYFYYQTPLRGDSNKILFKNNIVVYALENVYSDYRGTYESMIQLFGQPDFTLYSSNLFSGHWYA